MPIAAKRVVLNPDKPLQAQLQTQNATYVIKRNVDLQGKTLKIPQGAVLKFKKGRLTNGKISGSMEIKGKILPGSLDVEFVKGSEIRSILPLYQGRSAAVASQIRACTKGCELKEDLVLDKSVYLNAPINGRGRSMTFTETLSCGLYVAESVRPISITDLTIVKHMEKATINKNVALHISNSSNVTVCDCSIYGRISIVNKRMSDATDSISENITIERCQLTCDLTDCLQGWEYGQDHILVKSIKNLTIRDCNILSTNVNRVMKTTSYFEEREYSFVSRCTDGVNFSNNTVRATAVMGKQFWDMYCGTLNARIIGNTIDIKGFTRFVEDKAYQDKHVGDELAHSLIEIAGNNVRIDGGDLFQFRASPNCDSFEVRNNCFEMVGSNTNADKSFVRSAGIRLQGYKSCVIEGNSFVWKDEAIGCQFANMNFDCRKTVIKGNTIQDAYRIYVSKAIHPTNGTMNVEIGEFEYTDNKKTYSKSYKGKHDEIMLSDVNADTIVCAMPDNEYPDEYQVILQKNSDVDELQVETPGNSKKAVYKAASSSKVGNMQVKQKK